MVNPFVEGHDVSPRPSHKVADTPTCLFYRIFIVSLLWTG